MIRRKRVLTYGALAGALVGAISLGLAIGVPTLLGMRTGMIVMEREAAYLNTASAVTQFMEGFGAARVLHVAHDR